MRSSRRRTNRSMGSAEAQSQSLLGSIAFVVLIFQTTATVLMTRYSRMPATGEAAETPPFATTSAVAIAEFCKMWVGVIYVFWDIIMVKKVHNPISNFTNQLVGNNIFNFLKMSIPGIAYALQNNLLFVALHHLDSAIYQVVYQIKTFTAAIFAVIILGRSYTNKQWLSFALLACGAICANFSIVDNHSSSHAAAASNDADGADTAPELDDGRNMYIGIVCILGATITSGFSGVFIEKELKNMGASLWIRNIQLGLFGCMATLGNSYLFGDWNDIISKYGFIHGFTASTWIVVALNTFGGYLVAILIQNASNQAKAFAAGIAIVLVVLGSTIFFGSELTLLFFVGLAFTLGANVLYNRENWRVSAEKEQKKKARASDPELAKLVSTHTTSPKS